MPPARGDREARREDVSEAVWRTLAAQGFGGLTLRAVAAEMDVSTGMLMHYFPTKRALVAHALDVLEKRTAERPRRGSPTEGLAALRAALLDILPLTEDDTARNRVWVSSWDLALADGELGSGQAERYARMRSAIRPHIEAARDRGEVPAATDADQLAASAVAFTHGLVVQALFDPERFPESVQISLMDGFLSALACDGPTASARTARPAPARGAARRSGVAVDTRAGHGPGSEPGDH
ncbi:TetR/AcrR family transcriptional regulator [Streptomyces corynorhini]|uniref:TetR family transcriptional regulator n=1 Tax=Streptomyces corynorhini TaxID=2282652 RepID=A0A370AYA0_9ACTN|nr:TetR family transcriptional regulator C-terminal domain-containing protein [Streptomyces corynorhini]RDG34568.1 TetR family transcriptional regulator [Streptomyces corynorhini]